MYVCTFDQGTYLKIHTPRRTLKYYTNRALCPTLVCYVKDSFHTSKGIGIPKLGNGKIYWGGKSMLGLTSGPMCYG